MRSASTERIGEAAHDHLIRQIYELAEEPEGWQALLADLSAATHSEKAHAFVRAEAGEVLESLAHGADDRTLARYHRDFQQLDPRSAISTARLGEVLSDVEVIEGAAFERSVFYNEFLRREDCRYSMFVTANIGHGLVLGTAFMRPRTQPAYVRAMVRSLQRLLPHFARATHLRRLLQESRELVGDLEGALDAQPIPLAIVEADGKLVCANAEAGALLAGRRGLVLRHQRLSATRPAEASAIAEALRQTARLADEGRRRTLSLPEPPRVVQIARDDGRPLSLTFTPLRPRHGLRDRGDRRSRVVVMILDPESRLRLDPKLIAHVHQLTPTEARVAAAIAEGQTPRDFAKARGISEETVRTHLKRVLEKTGVRRQPELVRLLLSSVAVNTNR